MTKRAFDTIAEGLREAIDIARGDARPAKLHVPDELDIKTIRARLEMSHEAFASAFGFSLTQIRDWEQGRSRPLRSDRAYLMLIENDPAGVLKALRAARRAHAPRDVA